MDIPTDLLPDSYLWSGALLYMLATGAALITAPWSKVRDSEAQHVYLGAIVAVSLLWLMRAGVPESLSLHLLGMTSLCLMFEWQFALFAASLVVVVSTAQGPAGWEAFGVNVLLTGALPVLFTRVCLYVSQRSLPHNYFIYVFVNAFLAGAVSILIAVSASALLHHVAGVYPGNTIAWNLLEISPLLMFGEAFINGGAITLVVAYRPQWIATFHDSWYLSGK